MFNFAQTGEKAAGLIMWRKRCPRIVSAPSGITRRHLYMRRKTRSHHRCRPQGRRFDPAGFSFGFGVCGKGVTVAFRPMGLRHRRRPRKSGGPPPFELSLQVERNNAHSAFSVHEPAPVTDPNVCRALKVHKRHRRNLRPRNAASIVGLGERPYLGGFRSLLVQPADPAFIGSEQIILVST